MDIKLGRTGNQPFPLTESSISKNHASFHLDEQTGKMTLRDENSTNGTYIKSNDGTFKRLYGETTVSLNTVVRLGVQQCFVIKDLIKQKTPLQPKPKTQDISKLRYVYEAYNSNKMSLEAKTSNIMMLRIASMSLSSIFVIIIPLFLPENVVDDTTKKVIQVVGTILALIISWVLVDMKSKDLIRQKDQNERYFKKKYCCPECGFHFGPRIYENILAEGRCPNNNCKCKFTGK